MNLYCIKWLNIAKLKHDIDATNKLYSICVDCGFKIISDFNNGDFSDYFEELNVKGKPRLCVLKDFD